MQKNLLKAILRSFKGGTFAVTYWDGQTEVFGDDSSIEPPVRIIFNEELNFKEMLLEPVIQFGEAYLDQKIDFEGDLHYLFRLLIKNEHLFREGGFKDGLFQRFMKYRAASPSEQKQDDTWWQYDLGNDFYKLWLDKTMSYSCAYFKDPGDSLEQAQMQKIDYTLKKLNLKEGETLLDIGCGWGWLIIRAAREYGVKALGITLSTEQEEETRKRIEEEGLQDMVQVRLADYRDLAVEKLTFDKIISLGMLKHVGKEFIPVYFSSLQKILKPQGLSLLHTVTRPLESPPMPWMEKYIFPWDYVPSLREVLWNLPEYSFHIIDMESLRMHYAMTTRRWAKNFDRVTEQVSERYGERFVRLWKLYLVGRSELFLSSGLDVHQILFCRDWCNELPLTREYLYR